MPREDRPTPRAKLKFVKSERATGRPALATDARNSIGGLFVIGRFPFIP